MKYFERIPVPWPESIFQYFTFFKKVKYWKILFSHSAGTLLTIELKFHVRLIIPQSIRLGEVTYELRMHKLRFWWYQFCHRSCKSWIHNSYTSSSHLRLSNTDLNSIWSSTPPWFVRCFIIANHEKLLELKEVGFFSTISKIVVNVAIEW